MFGTAMTQMNMFADAHCAPAACAASRTMIAVLEDTAMLVVSFLQRIMGSILVRIMGNNRAKP